MKWRIDARMGLVVAAMVLWGCPIDDAHFKDPPAGSSSSSSGDVSSSSSSSSSSNSSASSNSSSSSNSSNSSSSGSSSSGGGGNGGAGGMGGAGGAGGGPVCPAMPGESGSCGTPNCPPCPSLVMLATGTNGGKTSTFVSGKNWDMAAPVADAKSDSSPAFGILQGQGKGVALIRSSADGAVYPVKYLRWDANGFEATAVNLTPLPLATRGTPAVVASSTAVHFVISGLGADHKYYYAAYDGMSFTPSDEVVNNPTDSLGYCSPGLTLLGNQLTSLNPGFGDEALYNRIRTIGPMGLWDTGYAYPAFSFQVDDVTPAIVVLSSQGPKYLVVVTEKNAPGGDVKPMYSLTGAGTNWTTPSAIPAAKSIQIALLALPGGQAILAFREYNSNTATPMPISWTRYDGTQWSSVQNAATNVTALSRPVLALGAGDAEVELLFIDSASNAQHARLRKGAMNFDPPTAIPGATGLVGIAAATNL